MEPGRSGLDRLLGASRDAALAALRRQVRQIVEISDGIGSFVALDPVENILIGLRARLTAFGIQRRGEIGDTALIVRRAGRRRDLLPSKTVNAARADR